MPTINCEVCNRLQKISVKQWKYLDPSGPFVCSKECVIKWLELQKVGSVLRRREMFCEENIFIGARNIDWASEVWSPKLRAFFRSKYEQFFAEYMSSKGFTFLYEALHVTLGKKHWRPDFWFPNECSVIEVKGAWGVSAKTKVREFRKAFPDIPLLVVSWVISKDFYKEAMRQ